MALIVETGAVVAGAESYISVADATTYHTNIGNAAWAALASDTIREQCLRKATSYMVQAYRNRWAGYRFGTAQTLDWPRSYVPIPDAVSGYGSFVAMVSPTIVPVEVKNACAELALRASAGDLAPDIGQNVVSEKIDTIEVVYDKYSPAFVVFRSIDNMLAPYLTGNSNMVAINRV